MRCVEDSTASHACVLHAAQSNRITLPVQPNYSRQGDHPTGMLSDQHMKKKVNVPKFVFVLLYPQHFDPISVTSPLLGWRSSPLTKAFHVSDATFTLCCLQISQESYRINHCVETGFAQYSTKPQHLIKASVTCNLKALLSLSTTNASDPQIVDDAKRESSSSSLSSSSSSSSSSS